MAFARGEDTRLTSSYDTNCQGNAYPGYGGRTFPNRAEPRRRTDAPACTAPARTCTARGAGIPCTYASRAIPMRQKHCAKQGR